MAANEVTEMAQKLEIEPSTRETCEHCSPIRTVAETEPARYVRCTTETIMEVKSNDDIITVHVGTGDNKATFMTDKRYIYQVSKFFANALKGGFREAEERVLRLPDDDPAAFRLWTHFQRNEYGYNESEGAAYRTSPYKSTKKEDPERTDHMWNFVKGWIFGEKYGFPEFQDFMMTSLRGICAEGFVEELFIARDTPHFSSNEHKCGQVSYVGPGYNVDPNDTWGTEPPTREDYADTHNWRCDCTHNVVWEMMSDLFLVEGNKAWFALKVQCEGKESQEPSGGW